MGSHYASGSQQRSLRGGKKHVLKSRRVLWLGPPSLSAGGAALAAQGSHESDGGVQYHVTRRLQAAGSHGGDGVQHRATGRCQTAASRANEGGVQYQAMIRFPAVEPHAGEGSVPYRATGWVQAAWSTLNGQGGGLRRR